jgi:hypothetical protein
MLAPCLPAADPSLVAAHITQAQVVGWLRALAGLAGTGGALAAFARVGAVDMPEVSALLGFCDAEEERGVLVDIAVRWAMEAGLLRLRTGMLRPARRHLPLLDDPAALWFRQNTPAGRAPCSRLFAAPSCPHR